MLPKRTTTIPHINIRSRAILAVLMLPLAHLPGCASEVISSTTTRPLPPPPHAAPVTPADAPISEMAFAVGSKPVDSDGNGFPDTIEATVLLFASPHPTPTFGEGRLEIAMYSSGTSSKPGAKPLATWTIAGEALEHAKRTSPIGPHYWLSLNLLDSGTDQYPLSMADLVCTYIPESSAAEENGAAATTAAKPVTSNGVRSIQIGR